MFDQPIVRAAAEGEIVDIGVTAVGPVLLGMVDLTAVTGHRAPRVRTATIPVVQHNSLIGRSDPFGPPQPQPATGNPIEDAQVVIAVAGHPDQIGHRQLGAAAGHRHAGLVLQILQTGRDDHGDRQAVVLAEFRVTQSTAGQRRERIVLALTDGATVSLSLLRRWVRR